MRRDIFFLAIGIFLGSIAYSFFLRNEFSPSLDQSNTVAVDHTKKAVPDSLPLTDLPEKNKISSAQTRTEPPASSKVIGKGNIFAVPFKSVDFFSANLAKNHNTGTEKKLLAEDSLKESLEKNNQEEQSLSAPVVNHGSQIQYSHSLDISTLPFSPAPSKFSVYKLGTGNGPTLLVIGGIQGDEPGGFSAASLLATHYNITSGSIWVVPDLNYSSILGRGRGVFGDMNRKFAALKETDPEYGIVNQIKKILLDKQVDLVLNLHDGSGYYRPTWEGEKKNPKKWGQSIIIDQKEINAPKFNQLEAMATRAQREANQGLVSPDHQYHVHNTNTSLGDVEMEKSLSYFVICHGKAAFGIEASKEFTTEYRSYYHMRVIESFMSQMGIGFERSFSLEPKKVLVALNSNLKVSLFNGKIVLPLDNVRPMLGKIPFDKNSSASTKSSHPLLSLVNEKKGWRIAYGNRTLTRLQADFMPFDNSLLSVKITVDGIPKTVAMGDIVGVKNSFEVEDVQGYRVNVIGAMKEVNGTEAGVLIKREDFLPRFSIDKSEKIYRVEFYKGSAFVGMILVDFGGRQFSKSLATAYKRNTSFDKKETLMTEKQ